MSLLSPTALWLGLIGLVVVALYLLKIRRRRQAVPSLEFWRQLAGETQVRSLFRRLKRWLSLLLWLAIVAGMVFAVANPIITTGKMKPRTIVLVIDNSASMQTVEDDGTRFESARKAIAELVNRRPVSDEWMLIEAGHDVRVLQSFTRDRKAVLDAANTLQPQLAGNRLNEAITLAEQLLTGKPEPLIVVISDGAGGKIEEWAESADHVVHYPIGKADDNLGLTKLAVRPRRATSEHHVLVEVVNESKAPVESQLLFEIDGTVAKVEPLDIAAGGRWEKTVVFTDAQGGVLRAVIDRDDALDEDNEAYSILEPSQPAVVYLVTEPDEAFFFEQVLVAMSPLIDLESSRTITPSQYEQLGNADEEADLVVFNRYVPKVLPERAIHVANWPEQFPVRKTDIVEGIRLEVSQPDHPLMRYLRFGAATIARADEIELLEPVTVLASTPDGAPVIFLYEEPNRRSLVLTFNVMETDLPIRNSFPILMRNAVTFFMQESSRLVHRRYQIGDTIESLVPMADDYSTVTVGTLRDGELTEEPLPVEAGRFQYNGTSRPGPLRFVVGDEVAYTAVNLTDEGESRIAPKRAEWTVEDRLRLTDRWAGTVPWRALAGLVLALVSLEWFSYHKRWTE